MKNSDEADEVRWTFFPGNSRKFKVHKFWVKYKIVLRSTTKMLTIPNCWRIREGVKKNLPIFTVLGISTAISVSWCASLTRQENGLLIRSPLHPAEEVRRWEKRRRRRKRGRKLPASSRSKCSRAFFSVASRRRSERQSAEPHGSDLGEQRTLHRIRTNFRVGAETGRQYFLTPLLIVGKSCLKHVL